jgi:hypothetical protein
VDNLFSSELKELVSKSREAAIELGYDYISTIHFFIADCENNRPNSILKFGFSDDQGFKKFKTDYTLEKVDFLDLLDESLPLTKEAEKTIRLTESERIFYKQTEVYPCHFFLAALKNQESLLFECFKHDENALASLIKYYEDLGDFEKSKMSLEQISKEYYEPNQNNKSGFLGKLAKVFKRRE